MQINETVSDYIKVSERVSWDVNKKVKQWRRSERRTDGREEEREGRWKAGNARMLPDRL